jgi:hypothetical protein
LRCVSTAGFLRSGWQEDRYTSRQPLSAFRMGGSIFTRVAKVRYSPVLIVGPRFPVHAVSRRDLLKMLLMAKCLTPAIQRCNHNITVQPFRGIAESAARLTTTLTSRVAMSRIETLTPRSSNWLLLLRDTQRASETVF